MAAGGGNKRKRGDRTFSQDSRDEGLRPSPHRPGNLNLARQSNALPSPQQQSFNHEHYDQRGGGRRRASRGGRGGGPPQRGSPIDSPNSVPVASRIVTPAKVPSSPPASNLPNHDGHDISTQQQPSTSETATQTVEEQPAPTPFHYEVISEETLRRWEQTGRSAVLSAGHEAQASQDHLALSALFQELSQSALEGRLDMADAGSIIKNIVERDNLQDAALGQRGFNAAFDAVSLFLDCLSVLDESFATAAKLKPFMLATGIPPLRMRLELSEDFLKRMGIVRNTFDKQGIRKQTHLIYKQSNYNLLREETEGFSKLITELFTTSSITTNNNNELLTPEIVEETFEHIKGMIGTFDMDVGRVLDVTLDVFAAVLVKQYRFFVKLFRTSSWWPQQPYHQNPPAKASDTLPRWALPGSPCYPYSTEEKSEIVSARDVRDTQFWKRASDIGMAAYFEIVGRRVEVSITQALKTLEEYKPTYNNKGELETVPQSEIGRRWIEATGTLPPKGNYMAAQILGFKLRFYSSSARGPSDILPENLIFLAALLIKIGFISLIDLYPHLWPADDAMERVREEKMKEKAEREKQNRPGGGALNALASAGALPDDMPSMPVGRLRESDRLREADNNRNSPAVPDVAGGKAQPINDVEVEEELPEPSEQKVQLLKSLLCIGALPEALFMLGRFPWLPDAFIDLPDYIHRILHYSLSKVYERVRPLRDYTELKEPQKCLHPDQSGISKGILKRIDPPPRKQLRWAHLDKDDTNEGIDYRFYWDDWTDMIPVCQTMDDVFVLCKTLLNFTGVKIGKDPLLLMKFTRIGKQSLIDDPSETNRSRWYDLLKRLIVPALSMTKNNPGVVNDVFDFLKKYSVAERYSIYAEWYQGQTSRLPDMSSAFEQVKAETKDVLKRISKTNTKPMARALGRVASASPGIVFQVMISQIESYDNLIDSVVDCARYFTYLSYDILSWSLISSLGARGRSRVQADGMLTSKWLQAISLYSGRMFKRWHVMDVTPVLQYVSEQLRQSNPTDLIVLEQITNNMAGIVSDTNFNDAQVLAMAGGDLLQAQTMLQLHDQRHEVKIIRTSKILLKALTGPRLAGQLLVAIAQERQTCVYKLPEHNAPLKVLGNQFDELHRIFVQYLDLLRSNLSVKDFDDLVPGVAQLIADFGLDPNIAFYIARPGIAAAMLEHDKAAAKLAVDHKKPSSQESKEDVKKSDGHGNVFINESASVEGGEASQDKVVNGINGSVISEKMDVDGEEPKVISPTPVPSPTAAVESARSPWHPVLKGVMDAVESALPSDTWDAISPSFFVTFWSLSLYDMHVPTQSYDDEVNRLKKQIQVINNDRSDVTKQGTEKKEKDRKAVNEIQDRLRAEVKDQIQTYSQTRAKLQKEKEAWFADFWGKSDALNAAILEQCFFPRLTLSPVDALYVYKLFKFLHSSGTTNFRSIGLLDQLFNEKRLTSILFLCTAKEAENFGRFLNELLKELGRWHADKSIYEKEAYGTKKDLPGFAKRLDTDTSKKPVEFLSYEEFRRIMLKWHRSLHVALKTNFTSGEYMHIRNAINVMRAIYQQFPVVNYMGSQQVACISQLSQNESREDLKIAAASLLGNLKRREKDWVLPQAFNLVSRDSAPLAPSIAKGQQNEIPVNGSNGQRGASARPSTPQADGESKKPLNPKAPDFQPNARPSTDGASEPPTRTPAHTRTDAEDGEIDDARMSNAPLNSNATPGPQAPAIDTATDNVAAQAASQVTQSSAANVSVKAASTSQTSNQTLAGPERGSTTSAPLPQKQAPLSNVDPPVSVTTTTKSPAIPSKPETSRSSSASAVNGRLPHSLPSRPEPPYLRAGDSRLPDRPIDHRQRDYPRDARFPDRNGPDRPRDSMHEGPSERHNSGLPQRGPEPPAERPQNPQRDRSSSNWGPESSLGRLSADDRYGALSNRDTRSSPRDERKDWSHRDRPAFGENASSRNPEMQMPPNRDQPMAPPRSSITQHPDRVALIHGGQDRDKAPFSSPHTDARHEGRNDRYPNSERSSRAPSPSRPNDRRGPRYEGRHEDRQSNENRQGPHEPSHPYSARYDESRLPTGPRTDRSAAQGAHDRFRESPRNASNAPPANETSRRLHQESGYNNRQQESQYGRLNPGPELPMNRAISGSDVPSGPRLPNGNNTSAMRTNGRNHSSTQPQPTPQQAQQPSVPPPNATQTQDRQTPTGPSARNPRPSLPMPKLDTAQIPPATSESPDTAGVHPDRLRAIQGAVKSIPGNVPPSPNSMGRPARPPLPPVAVPATTVNRPPHGQLPSPGGPNPSPMAPMTGISGPSPTGRGPPTGPSSTNDRSRGDRRMLAGLQNVLQQAGTQNIPERANQGASIRGRGGRASHMPVHPPSINGPPTPSMSRQEQERGDLMANRNGIPPPQLQGEDDGAYGRSARRGPPREPTRDIPRDFPRDGGRDLPRDGGRGRDVMRDEGRDGERRSGRHRESRDHSRDPGHGSSMPARDDERTGRDRGRQHMPPPTERDMRRPPRGDDGRRAESDRRDIEGWGGDRERRDGGGGGRKRGRGGDDGRVHDESKRQRRVD